MGILGVNVAPALLALLSVVAIVMGAFMVGGLGWALVAGGFCAACVAVLLYDPEARSS